jgi:tripartite-type tricarboxylate transporter receptor subunit TctC
VRSPVAVKNDLPAKNYAELLQMAKAQPGKINYATNIAIFGRREHRVTGPTLARSIGYGVK